MPETTIELAQLNLLLNAPHIPRLPEASRSGISSKNPGSFIGEHTSASVRHVSRTPSPTPSEVGLLTRRGVLDLDRMKDWRFWFRREWLFIAVAILVGVEHTAIVRWIEPVAKNLKRHPANWLIPVAIFFVISFPPLFGHEIIALLCGIVYGLWVGFAITAVDTAAEPEEQNLKKQTSSMLAWRDSAIPGHFTTAIFSTCGIRILSFTLAAALSLPKQLVLVYLGVVFEDSGSAEKRLLGDESKKEKLISVAIIIITSIITWVAMRYILHQMASVKVDVVHDRRKARQEKLERISSLNTPLMDGSRDLEADPEANASIRSPTPRRTFVA
ncbi:hypothetical protein EW145_g6636 [Phellinidium pouzarii]|uniref:Golgi apparatus membrane protein TVP38 n=1 Tax=Phellinidium pouzarii TaxID=167371 RepID=A0A4S4KVX6_9AGAM|nr:hypothetical protein EW145_g6636 [Phellinidium pouzarii]